MKNISYNEIINFTKEATEKQLMLLFHHNHIEMVYDEPEETEEGPTEADFSEKKGKTSYLIYMLLDGDDDVITVKKHIVR